MFPLRVGDASGSSDPPTVDGWWGSSGCAEKEKRLLGFFLLLRSFSQKHRRVFPLSWMLPDTLSGCLVQIFHVQSIHSRGEPSCPGRVVFVSGGSENEASHRRADIYEMILINLQLSSHNIVTFCSRTFTTSFSKSLNFFNSIFY